MCFDAKQIIGNPHQYLYDHSAIQEYLSEQDMSPDGWTLAEIDPIEQLDSPPFEELTLADIDPFEYEQFEQELRDTQLEKDNRWLSQLMHFGMRKRR